MTSGVGPASGLFSSRTARRRGIAYVLLVAVTLLLMAFSSAGPIVEVQKGIGYAFRPLQSFMADVARGADSLGGAVVEIDQLRRTNAALQQENERLKAENGRMDEVKRENEVLTGLLQLRSGLDYKTVAASVIARESSEFRRVVSIDVGTDKGVKVGDVVIAAGGALAGRVVEASPGVSTVLLINDTASTVIGQMQSTAATGEVIGQLGGVLIMQNVDSTEKVQIGDEVVTAGIELGSGVRSPYPKGLLIGQVVDVSRDANAVVQTAYLQPSAELDKLEYVLVITNYEGGLPDVVQQPTNVTNPDGTLPDTEQPFITPGAPTAPAGSSRAGASATPLALPTPTVGP
jgi:rod shape-determining protein MreC